MIKDLPGLPRGKVYQIPDIGPNSSVMKNSLAFFAIIVLASCTTTEQEPSITIQNVTTIDAANGSRSDQTVVIVGKKIVKVGPAVEVAPPPGSTIVDGAGKFLIPGLWDAHVHLTYEQEISPSIFSLFLVNGVTSIRDTGGLLELVMPWKEKSLSDDGSAPRVMVAGPLLDGVPTVYSGEGGRPKIGLGAANPQEAEVLVDSFVDAGVDLIKSYEMLSPESYKAVLERSASHGMQVTGHVPLSMDVIEASNLGLSSMEHMRNLEMACSSDYDSLLAARQLMLAEGADQLGGDLRGSIHRAQRVHAIRTQDDNRRQAVLSALATNGTWQIPTLTIVGAMENRLFDRQSWRDNFKYLPDSVQKRWTALADTVAQRPTPEENTIFANWGFDMVRRLDKAGVGIMAGTDTPIFLLTPGFSLHEELRLLVQSGLSPMKALEAATLKPAQYFGLESELGSIAVGMLADLVLLDANPIEDINNTQSINAVVKSGKLYSRQDLDQILRQLEVN